MASSSFGFVRKEVKKIFTLKRGDKVLIGGFRTELIVEKSGLEQFEFFTMMSD